MTFNKKSIGLVIVLISLLIVNMGWTPSITAKEATKDEFEILANQMTLENDKLVAKGDVKVNSNQGRMTGDKFWLNNSTETGELIGNPILNSQGWRVTGSKFEIDFAKEELFIPSNAHMESKKLVADANQLRFLNQKDQAVLTGQVVVIDQDRRLTGDKVIINLKTEKINSIGRTKLTLPSKNQNSGEKK
ncbi:LptA/OstA family protein [Selenihalanaerobacter shriftii]|uniref:LptA/OstA family protein n=1 Tax=Selenihalanaerobacter shriftii TaxID=142842 RepID=UPI0013565D76|nr:LptA/OstA family protein [Selenihalanaerobacter shriftii]